MIHLGKFMSKNFKNMIFVQLLIFLDLNYYEGFLRYMNFTEYKINNYKKFKYLCN